MTAETRTIKVMAISGGNVTVPFTVPDLASLLGVGKVSGLYRGQDLCTAAAINMWSKVKPVRSYREGPLTAAQFAEVNFGFDLAGIITYSPAACLALAKTNAGAWTYLKPRGRVSSSLTEWYRLRDFNGYHHGAAQPYECFAPASVAVKNFAAQVYDMSNEGGEIALTDLTELADGTDTGRLIGDWRLGIAYRLGTSGNVQVVYHSDVLDDCFVDTSGEGGREQFNIAVSSNGTYEWCLFITDYDPTDSADSGNSYRYVYLPGGFGQVVVNESGGDTPIPPSQLAVTIDLTHVTVTGAPYVTTLGFDVTVYSDDEYDVEVYAYLYDENGYPLKNDYDAVSTVGSEEYIYPELTGINFLGNYEKPDLFMRFKLRFRQGSGSWTEVWYNPITGQYTANQPNAYDIDTIIDSLSEE